MLTKPLLTAACVLAFFIGGAKASALYTVETRTWAICESKEVAESIGKIYEEQGAEAAFFAWESATSHDFCLYRTEAMTPIEVTFRARDLKVVKVLDDAGKEYYWTTLETFKENSQ